MLCNICNDSIYEDDELKCSMCNTFFHFGCVALRGMEFLETKMGLCKVQIH